MLLPLSDKKRMSLAIRGPGRRRLYAITESQPLWFAARDWYQVNFTDAATLEMPVGNVFPSGETAGERSPFNPTAGEVSLCRLLESGATMKMRYGSVAKCFIAYCQP